MFRIDLDVDSVCCMLPTASFAHRENTQLCLFSCLYVLVNITAINSKQPKGRSNVLIQTEVVKPVRDLRAGEL